jgi:hypothetical protein
MNLIPDFQAMNKYRFPVLLFFTFLFCEGFSAVITDFSGLLPEKAFAQDTTKENQILYNGKIWRNLYTQVRENQFLFTSDFLAGSVTIRGKVFDNVSLKYDIFKDELLTPADPGGILQINKERVDSFTLLFENKRYEFISLPDSANGTHGYFNLIYKGQFEFYRKYIKKIDKLSVDGQSDRFYQLDRLYLLKDNELFPVTGKNDLQDIFKEKKALIKTYLKKSDLDVSVKEPESFIPLIRYIESIGR